MDLYQIRNAAIDANDWRLVAATLAADPQAGRLPRVILRDLFVIGAQSSAIMDDLNLRKVKTCLAMMEASDAKGS